jgi:hypothetical protein
MSSEHPPGSDPADLQHRCERFEVSRVPRIERQSVPDRYRSNHHVSQILPRLSTGITALMADTRAAACRRYPHIDHDRGVEQAELGPVLRVNLGATNGSRNSPSTDLARSSRSRRKSTAGRPSTLRRMDSAETKGVSSVMGVSRATGVPLRVTMNASPRSVALRMRPISFRNSRCVIVRSIASRYPRAPRVPRSATSRRRRSGRVWRSGGGRPRGPLGPPGGSCRPERVRRSRGRGTRRRGRPR